MALIDCPDCTRPVSDAAVSCPNCGRPIAARAAHHDDHFSPDLITVFVRTVLEATLRPERFLVRSSEEPLRYASPKRILLASAVVAGLTLTFVNWVRPLGLPTLVQKLLAGLATVAMPWIMVIAFRLSGRVAGVPKDWVQATRLAGFVRAPSLFLAPLNFALMLLTGSQYAPMPIMVAIGLFYGMLGFRSFGLSRSRAFSGAFVAWALANLLWGGIAFAFTSVLAIAGIWVPDLRFQHGSAGH
jgi:hypothetical protein